MYRLDIPAILASHNAEHAIQIRLYDRNGMSMFPVYAVSGGLSPSALLYLHVGELDLHRDMGVSGLVRHTYGFSWALEIGCEDRAENKLRKALEDFDEALRAEKWTE